MRELAAERGNKARAMTVDDTARFGDIILLTIPWRTPEGLTGPELVADKVVIDGMNSYTATGGFFDMDDSTSSEETLKRLPGARLV